MALRLVSLINDMTACDGEGFDSKARYAALSTVRRLDTVEFGA